MDYSKYHSVIFDVDGTVLNTLDIWKQIDCEYLAQFGIDCPNNLQSTIAGMSIGQQPTTKVVGLKQPAVIRKPELQFAEQTQGCLRAVRSVIREYGTRCSFSRGAFFGKDTKAVVRASKQGPVGTRPGNRTDSNPVTRARQPG